MESNSNNGLRNKKKQSIEISRIKKKFPIRATLQHYNITTIQHYNITTLQRLCNLVASLVLMIYTQVLEKQIYSETY